MKVWGATDKGMVRQMNQDYYRYSELGKDQYLAVVCDGMGGAKSGDVASRLASEIFHQDVRQTVVPDMEQQDIVRMLVNAVKSANRAVYEQSQVSPDFAGMGTTLVAVFLQGASAYIVNVGDSRCYYVAENRIMQITEDHSVVGLMVARGQITEEEARVHPNKNLITRAVGTEQDVECDCFYLSMEPGEHLVLCTDGLSNLVTKQELLHAVTDADDRKDGCTSLIELAKSRGASDNVTVVLLEF